MTKVHAQNLMFAIRNNTILKWFDMKIVSVLCFLNEN